MEPTETPPQTQQAKQTEQTQQAKQEKQTQQAGQAKQTQPAANATILIADDEKNIRDGLAHFAHSEGYETVTAADGEQAFRAARTLDIDCALIDLRMPKMDGAALLTHLVSERPALPVIVITGHGTVQNAVSAMRHGAYDFVTKPVNLDRLSALLKRALANRRMILRTHTLQDELDDRRAERAPASANPAMRRLMEVARHVAQTNATVLITGESGVGKEIVADYIHAQSQRRHAPLVKVHCASLSETLLESELFGHEKGAFTGAISQRKGRFELAHTGTILLDEIGEINQTLQVKILRVLQEKEFERVGGEKTISVDTRIIAATNRNLADEMARGRFREDLYYRLNVVHIEIPPLREREEDIPLFIARFLREFSAANGTGEKSLSPQARRLLLDYRWPGNIRELRNCIESAVILCAASVIEPHHLPKPILRHGGAIAGGSAIAEKIAASDTTASADDTIIAIPIHSSLEEAERRIIHRVLQSVAGNKSQAAAILGMQRNTLYDKLKKYGLDR